MDHVLVLDDERSMCSLIEHGLSRRGFQVSSAHRSDDALTKLDRQAVDALLLDVRLGESDQRDGLEVCHQVAAGRPDVALVVMTAFGSTGSAVGALRAGADDFVTKPVDMGELRRVLERAIRKRRIERQVHRLQDATVEPRSSSEIVGESPAMQEVYRWIERLSGSEASVLVVGESGTGKELVARALHARSPRAGGPLVAVNCAAVPAPLLESTLFGHVQGAFTDARSGRRGMLREADGGTLFLDEIGDMSLEMQPKLLRALQERVVRPVGGSAEVEVDIRVIAATHHDLEAEIERGRFREDLYYRINVVRVPIPPLRERGSDVLLLAQHFIRKVADRRGTPVQGLSPEAAQKLLDYDWPGNVRELENCIERAVTLCRANQIAAADLGGRVQEAVPRALDSPVGVDDPELLPSLAELERRHIERVLSAVGGNKSAAARVLGVDRRTLYRKLERLDS